MLRGFNQCLEHIRDQTARHGPFPHVRVANGYLWDTIKGGMTYREFSILAAVHCLIGESKCARITRDRIRAAALGYKRASDLFDRDSKLTDSGNVLLSQRQDHAVPLKTEQLRYTLDGLEARKFFARVSVGRSAYFSNKLSREELRKTVFARRTWINFTLGKHRDEDRELAGRIQKTNSTKSANSPQSPRFYSDEGGQEPPETSPQAVTRTPPLDSPVSHQLVTTTIETPFIETPLIKTLSIHTRGVGAHAPEFQKPSLEEVKEFESRLHKNDCSYAGQWFEERGTDNRWTTQNWRKDASRYIFDAITKNNRIARLKQ